ncbi:helix-turn-helix transcriptional regulator [Microbacterium sp. SLBN-146]|uniref:ArsR/SmtB family transcription factor n=1 Tax=Microbacterium sp. SLBN-146 TaxID=2768457 RepID=UPI00114F0FBF|nr:metalloregulator ArsR/SmtB family transcription factor [Microbacterium sp. SLBN-146]TQJ29635.1 ArsR family transcriptional regulator [Microbacterium sp. SLBN-146]
MDGPLSHDGPLYEVKANLFKGLAHPVRVRILEILIAADEVAVGTLIDELRIEASHLSQHLAVLRRHRLVVSERRGSQVFYRPAFPEVATLLHTARKLLGDILTQAQQHMRDAKDLPVLPERVTDSR